MSPTSATIWKQRMRAFSSSFPRRRWRSLRSGRSETSSQLTPGSLVTEMFLFGVTEDPKALGIGDGDVIRGVRGKAGAEPGVGQLILHVHCDPDFENCSRITAATPESTEVNVE